MKIPLLAGISPLLHFHWMPWAYWPWWSQQFRLYSVWQSLCLAGPWTCEAWYLWRAGSTTHEESSHVTEIKAGEKSCGSMHRMQCYNRRPFHEVHCIVLIFCGRWSSLHSFCLELHSVNPIVADDEDSKFTELCTSDDWEIQEVIKSDFERKNGEQFFPVG